MKHEKKNIYFQLYNHRGGDFPVFQDARYIQYGNRFGYVLPGYLRHGLPVAVKGAASFFGSLMQKREEGQNGDMRQNNQFAVRQEQFRMKPPTE